MLIVLALLAAVVLGGLAALIAGTAVGLATAVLLLIAGVIGHRSPEGPRRGIGVVLLVALLAGGSYGGILVLEVAQALATTDGTPDPADPDLLGSAQDKLDGLDGAFRIELTEPELNAVVQHGLASDPSLPLRRVDLDLRGATQDLAFTATMRSGGLQADGVATVRALDGGIDVDLVDLRVRGLAVPAVARGALGSVLGAVTDLNAALASQQAEVHAVEVTDDLLVVEGVRHGGPLTGSDLLDAVREQSGNGVDAVPVPPERLGPGTVDGREAPGDPIVLALGDSLAAGEGVDRLADGYVSRFHRAVADRDGLAFGLRNLGISGETSATLLDGGQLATAEQILRDGPAAYVTVGIGANDLLGHLESPDCARDLRTAACQQRIETTLGTYRTNLSAVLDRLTAVSGDARVVILLTYNPFSLGLGEGDQERESSEAVRRLNDVAVEVATARGLGVADAFTPMQGTTAVTTRMLDPVPDIHPNALGHDILATALLEAS